jgi:ABC-type bacteriocin/lantibiotic exporter with double-glycine peptidase domain
MFKVNSSNFYQIFQIIIKILLFKEKKFFIILSFFTSLIVFLESIGIGSILLIIKYFFSGIPNEFLLKISKIANLDLNEKILINYLIIIFVFFFFIKIILQITYNNFYYKFISQIKKRLYLKVLNDYLRKEFLYVNYFSESKFYNYYNAISSYNLILININIILSELLSVILIILFLVLISPKLTSLILLATLFILFAYTIIINSFIKKKGLILNKVIQVIEKIKLTILLGFREIKIYRKESFFLDNAEKSVDKYFLNESETQIIRSYFKNFSEVVALSVILFFVFLSSKGFDGKILLETLTFIFLFFIRVLPSAAKIIPSYQAIIFNFPLVNNFLNNIEIKNKKKFFKTIKKNSFNKNFLFFENVSFGYSKNNLIINNFTMSFKKNVIVGIYGKSGSGKTTFMDLISGLKHPTNGNIFNNGQNIQINENWSEKISYISQSPFFLDGSIQENVAFGLKNNQIDKKNILNSLKQSQFEYKRKNILNYNVGLFAKFLSGGQKQRLAMARALYKKSEILLLDEFSNALDFETENKIFKIIKKLKKNRLIFIISHDYNLIKKCDTIIKINDNGILVRIER